MNPNALSAIGWGARKEPDYWRYRSIDNRVERVTAYCNKIEVVAMCTTPEMAAEIANAMEARPERDLAEGDSEKNDPHDH